MLTPDEGDDGIDELADALVLAVVESWSFGEVSLGVLDTLDDDVVKAIHDHCAEGGYVEKLMPDFSTPDRDEESPTPPSSV